MSVLPLKASPLMIQDIPGAIEGQDARILVARARTAQNSVLHVCLDDTRMAALAEIITFFAPDLSVLCFPAWDCLPYDRVSPRPESLARGLIPWPELPVAALPRLLF